MFKPTIDKIEFFIAEQEEIIKSAKEELVILRKKLKAVTELDSKAREMGVIE